MYTYSNTTKQALAWTKELSELKHIIEELAVIKFNFCLLNLYRNGNEGMGWHSDDEKPLGKNNTKLTIKLSIYKSGANREEMDDVLYT